MNPEMNTSARPPQKEPAGAMISIAIIVLIIIAGAYYFLRSVPQPETAQIETDAVTSALSTQGTSDEIADIQKDLNSTPDISTLGNGLGSM
jgi:hypothetical protein